MRLLSRLRRWIPRLPAREPPRSLSFADWEAWQAHLALHGHRLDAQYRLQALIPQATGTDGWAGWCGLCSQPTVFAMPSIASGGPGNLREEMSCSGCGLIARNRTSMALLSQDMPLATSRIYLTEQASTTYIWLQALCPGLEGSEFGLDPATRPRMQDWYECLGGRGELVERDVTQLDFGDASLDVIGSFDVLEHVPDYQAALREFARCLRRGGRLVLTAPFAAGSAHTLVRARIGADGVVEHLLEPEMHGDPVAGGVLCFYHFGWDVLDAARAAGFRKAEWIYTWSPREGLFGMWNLVATR